ncbi:LacI family DNA-binding transcriptional regulator [Propionibacteriaceae bacterium Y2011]
MTKPTRVRLRDVAAAAGVSVGTASEALNGVEGVSAATRASVVEVARRLGYTPNRSARSLAGRGRRSIGVLISGPTSMDWLFNPVFMEFFRSIQHVLSQQQVELMMEIAADDVELDRIRWLTHEVGVDGLILIGTRRPDAELAQLGRALQAPIVTLVRHPLWPGQPAVSVDNEEIGRMAADHLLELGHRSVGYIGALPGVGLAEERIRGFVTRLNEAGAALPAEHVRPGDYYQQSGQDEMEWLLDHTDVTAVFCGNDMMGLGAIRACLSRGVRVPTDLSVMGCDGIPNLDMMAVPLTTIALPASAMGAAAAHLVLQALDTPSMNSRLFSAELVVNGSTGPVPATRRDITAAGEHVDPPS